MNGFGEDMTDIAQAGCTLEGRRETQLCLDMCSRNRRMSPSVVSHKQNDGTGQSRDN